MINSDLLIKMESFTFGQTREQKMTEKEREGGVVESSSSSKVVIFVVKIKPKVFIKNRMQKVS